MCVSVLLLACGLYFLLLLNGQHFTNAVVFCGCAAASALFWVPAARPAQHSDGRLLARSVIAGHLIAILHIGVSLPRRQRLQTGYNNVKDQLRALHEYLLPVPSDAANNGSRKR